MAVLRGSSDGESRHRAPMRGTQRQPSRFGHFRNNPLMRWDYPPESRNPRRQKALFWIGLSPLQIVPCRATAANSNYDLPRTLTRHLRLRLRHAYASASDSFHINAHNTRPSVHEQTAGRLESFVFPVGLSLYRCEELLVALSLQSAMSVPFCDGHP